MQRYFWTKATGVLLLFAASVTTQAAPTLFESLGGEPALTKAVDELVVIALDDDRINFAFAQTDLNKFKQLLYAQLCELTSGPCRYTGRDMRTSHAKLAITNAQFNALAEDLYLAFDRAGVPYRVQNKVMALLAPMQRDIVKE
jgi:hemoglobin